MKPNLSDHATLRSKPNLSCVTGLRRKAAGFGRAEDGAATVLALFWTVTLVILGGVAVDVANAWRVQHQLQIAADAAALAAAGNITDLSAARNMAVSVAEMNLGTNASVGETDVIFGSWDKGSKQFTANTTDPDAVVVKASRSASHSNSLGTYMLRFAGIKTIDVSAGSYAMVRKIMSSGGELVAPANNCAAAMILSSGYLDAGGGNTFNGNVCIHGQTGVKMVGNDWFSPQARVSAHSLSDIQSNNVRTGSAPPEQVKVARDMDLTVLPNLPTMWAERWALFSSSTTQYSDPNNYFPSFLKNPATGKITIVRKKSFWAIHKKDLDPYTLYIVDGGAQFSGGVEAQNVGFVVNGRFGMGGGNSLAFKDIYIMADKLNLAGSAIWGDQDTVCNGERYSVYLFGLSSLHLGGWGNGTSIWGVIGAAPEFSPGGAMSGAGLYFEASETKTPLGGNMDLYGCPGGTPTLEAEMPITRPPLEEPPMVQVIAGASLVR